MRSGTLGPEPLTPRYLANPTRTEPPFRFQLRLYLGFWYLYRSELPCGPQSTREIAPLISTLFARRGNRSEEKVSEKKEESDRHPVRSDRGSFFTPFEFFPDSRCGIPGGCAVLGRPAFYRYPPSTEGGLWATNCERETRGLLSTSLLFITTTL